MEGGAIVQDGYLRKGIEGGQREGVVRTGVTRFGLCRVELAEVVPEVAHVASVGVSSPRHRPKWTVPARSHPRIRTTIF